MSTSDDKQRLVQGLLMQLQVAYTSTQSRCVHGELLSIGVLRLLRASYLETRLLRKHASVQGTALTSSRSR